MSEKSEQEKIRSYLSLLVKNGVISEDELEAIVSYRFQVNWPNEVNADESWEVFEELVDDLVGIIQAYRGLNYDAKYEKQVEKYIENILKLPNFSKNLKKLEGLKKDSVAIKNKIVSAYKEDVKMAKKENKSNNYIDEVANWMQASVDKIEVIIDSQIESVNPKIKENRQRALDLLKEYNDLVNGGEITDVSSEEAYDQANSIINNLFSLMKMLASDISNPYEVKKRLDQIEASFEIWKELDNPKKKDCEKPLRAFSEDYYDILGINQSIYGAQNQEVIDMLQGYYDARKPAIRESHPKYQRIEERQKKIAQLKEKAQKAKRDVQAGKISKQSAIDIFRDCKERIEEYESDIYILQGEIDEDADYLEALESVYDEIGDFLFSLAENVADKELVSKAVDMISVHLVVIGKILNGGSYTEEELNAALDTLDEVNELIEEKRDITSTAKESLRERRRKKYQDRKERQRQKHKETPIKQEISEEDEQLFQEFMSGDADGGSDLEEDITGELTEDEFGDLFDIDQKRK